MSTIFYIIFFGCLNLLIFLLLNKNLKVDRIIKGLLILIIISTFLYYFFNESKRLISDEHFFDLLFFSFCIIVLNIGFTIILPIFSRRIRDIKHSDIAEKYLVGFIKTLKDYLIYFIIFFYQISELI